MIFISRVGLLHSVLNLVKVEYDASKVAMGALNNLLEELVFRITASNALVEKPMSIDLFKSRLLQEEQRSSQEKSTTFTDQFCFIQLTKLKIIRRDIIVRIVTEHIKKLIAVEKYIHTFIRAFSSFWKTSLKKSKSQHQLGK